MTGRVDKPMGIVTLIVEALANIKPTEPLRFVKRAARKTRQIPQVILRLKYTSFTVRMQEKQTDKVIIDATLSSQVLTVTGRKTMGSGLSAYS
jgi:hypothetical protein